MDNPLKHKHHIVPKHMGGSNDKKNIVELSVEEHANAHKELYETYGKNEDLIAWQGLSKMIDKQDLISKSLSLGGKNSIKKHGSYFKGRKTSGNWAINPEHQAKCSLLSSSPEAKEKAIKRLAEIKHQQGEKNSMFGTMWIYNESLSLSKRILKDDEIPSGWKRGRKIYSSL